MDRRLFLLLLSFAVAASPLGVVAARADDGEDDSSDDDSGSDDGGSDDSADDDGEDSSSGTDDGGSTSGGTGGSTGSTSGGTGSSTSGTADHDRARAAVTDGNALPLSKLLRLFRQSFEGEVVDVTLVKRRSALVYRVKFVDPSGRVRRAEFDAIAGTVLD